MADGEVRIKITAEDSGLIKKLNALGAAAESAMKGVKSSVDGAGQALDALGSSVTENAGAFDALGQAASEAAAAVASNTQEAGSALEGVGDAAAEAGAEVSDAGEGASQALQEAGDAAEGMGESITGAGQGAEETLGGIGDSAEGAGQGLQEAGNQADTLQNKIAVLAAQYEKAQSEVDSLAQAFNKSVQETGAASDESQELAKQLNAAENKANSLKSALDSYSNDAQEAAEETRKLGDESEKAGSKMSGLGNIAKTVLKGVGAAAVAAGAAAVKLGKEVISSYAEYEQLVGGVETLFKDSSDQIMQYADNAYKTAGLSANEYMETVTGFSASLIQSLGGDTAQAAVVADRAITDMADNANKMGSSIESIQNAYQGFAKQNYTMLDNLKLGYGGTKSEMERLISDANKLIQSNSEYADSIGGVRELSIDSYADIVDAIHVVQTEMGITGTTAAEAEGTISGSLAMLQSSFQNLLTGLGSADSDISALAQNVISSLTSVLTNVLPVLEDMAKTVPAALTELIGAITPLLPEFLNAGLEIVMAIFNGLVQALPVLIPAAVEIVMTLAEGLIEALPDILAAGLQLIMMLIQGIGQALPLLIPMAMQAIITFVMGLMENLPQLILAAIQLITGLIQGLAEAAPMLIEAAPQLIAALIQGLIEAGPALWQAGCDLVIAIVDGLVAEVAALGDVIVGFFEDPIGSIKNLFSKGGKEAGAELDKGISDGVSKNLKLPESSAVDATESVNSLMISGLSDGGTQAGSDAMASLAESIFGNAGTAESAFSSTTEQFNALMSASLGGGGQTAGTKAMSDLAAAATTSIGLVTGVGEQAGTSFSEGVDSLSGTVEESGVNTMQAVVDGMESVAPEVVATAENAGTGAVEALDAMQGGFNSAGVQAMQGLLRGLESMRGAVMAKAQSIANQAVATMKRALDIHSPSRVFKEEIGENIGLGVAEGIDTSKDDAAKAAADLAKSVYSKSKEWADKQTKYQKYSLQEQLELWQTIQGQFIKESEQWADAEDKIFDLRESMLKEYESGVKEVYNNVSKLEENYAKELTSRTKEIYSAYKLFDEVPEKQKINGEELIKNLEGQVKSLEDFYSGLDALTERGVGEELVEEIRAMGVGAADELEALLSLSDEKLSEYAELYRSKQEFANAQAVKELESLRAETDRQILENIMSMEELFRLYSPSLGEEAARGVLQGLDENMPEVKQAMLAVLKASTAAVKSKSNELSDTGEGITRTIKDGMSNAEPDIISESLDIANTICNTLRDKQSDFYNVGLASMAGFKQGIIIEGQKAVAAAQSLANQAVAAMRSALEIHSPSRKMERQVGIPAAEGVMVGFEDELAGWGRRLQAVVDAETEKISFNAAAQAESKAAQSGITREVHTNSKTVEKVVRLEGEGITGELIRMLGLRLKEEEKRQGYSFDEGAVFA